MKRVLWIVVVFLAASVAACTNERPDASDLSATAAAKSVEGRVPKDQGGGAPLTEVTNSIGMRFVLIPGGQEFEMGARNGEPWAEDHEKPRHRVRITQPFLLGRYEVTQEEFERVMGFNLSFFSRGGLGRGKVTGEDTRRLPVDDVTWYDALAFCNKLSELETRRPYYDLSSITRDANSIIEATVKVLGGEGYRLPTEAEWECAARAGTTTIFAQRNSVSSEEANFDGQRPYGNAKKAGFLQHTVAVGSYAPNPWGLYDTAGNVHEWVWDGYDERYYDQVANETAVDPNGPEVAAQRVVRGGSWVGYGRECRPASRIGCRPGIPLASWRCGLFGFRVARGACEGQNDFAGEVRER